jgi:molecular chaperone GrpE
MVEDPNNSVDPRDEPAGSARANTPAQGDGAATDGAGTSESPVESLRKDLDSMKDRYLRSLADCQNIQKRAAAERIEAVHRGQAEIAKALLPALDNFERTMEAVKGVKNVQSVVEGVRIVHDQLLKVLGEFGLERMTLAKGDPFDPEYHQAVAQHPSDEVDPGHILHIAQAGYIMRGRLLRPASVVVAAGPEPAAREQADDGG